MEEGGRPRVSFSMDTRVLEFQDGAPADESIAEREAYMVVGAFVPSSLPSNYSFTHSHYRPIA
jgi:hypothetical protein